MTSLFLFQIYPDWHVFDDFVVTKLHQALKVDSLVNTRPMTHYTDRPAQIVQLFDTIIYEKGKQESNAMQCIQGANHNETLLGAINLKQFCGIAENMLVVIYPLNASP